LILIHPFYRSVWLQLHPDTTDEQLFSPPPLLHGTPPLVLHLRSRAISTFLKSFASSVKTYSPSQRDLIWRATRRMLEPELTLVTTTDELCYQWANFVLSFEISQSGYHEAEDVEQSEDPFRITVAPAESFRAISIAYREALVRYWQLGGPWEIGLKQAAQAQVSPILVRNCSTNTPDNDRSSRSVIRTVPDVLGKQTPHPARPVLLAPSFRSECRASRLPRMLMG